MGALHLSGSGERDGEGMKGNEGKGRDGREEG